MKLLSRDLVELHEQCGFIMVILQMKTSCFAEITEALKEGQALKRINSYFHFRSPILRETQTWFKTQDIERESMLMYKSLKYSTYLT